MSDRKSPASRYPRIRLTAEERALNAVLVALLTRHGAAT